MANPQFATSVPIGRGTRRVRRLKHKHRTFLVVNGIVAGCIAFAAYINPYADAGTAIYVALLSVICTLPMLFATSYRGRASLLIVFLSYYFATFGLSDLVRLFSYHTNGFGPGITASWGGSIAILLGAIFFLVGYAATTVLPVYRAAGWSAREWSPRATTALGVASWAVGWLATAFTQFGGADPNTGLHINPMIGGFLALTRYLQPIGSLLLIYLFLTTRNRKLLALLLSTMAMDAALGYFGGSKQIAIQAPILFLLSIVLLREKIPVVGLVVLTLVTAVFFNVFHEYRNELAIRGETRSAALAQIGSSKEPLAKSSAPVGKQLGGGLDHLLARISQKWVIDLLVARTGKNGIGYQDGATLTPLLYIFIPRLVVPDKPNNITGLMFNRTFSIAAPTTSIAITNLGDLYWNFGWAGIAFGMMITGAFMAWAATKFRLDTGLTAPKFLFLMVTIYFLVLRSEGGISLVYTLWARVAVLLLLVHAFMPKKRVRHPRAGDVGTQESNPS